MLVVVVCWGSVSWGRRTEPGINEREIRRKWKEFSAAKDKNQVRGNFPFRSCFEDAALKYGIPLSLLVAMARGESNFEPMAQSDKNCLGLMQIQWPGTAQDLGVAKKSDLFDPCINIHAGARYLSQLLEKFDGDLYFAVAAYNFGPNAVSYQHVPEGARWYAAYIHRHLQSVLSTPYRETGKVLILRFSYFHRATEFVSCLEKRVKHIPFEIFKSRRYTYDVFATYNNTKERKRHLRYLMETAGIKPLNGGRL